LVALNAVAWLLPANVFVEGESSDIGVYNWLLGTNDLVRFCGFLGQPNAIGALMLSTCSAGLITWNFTHRRRRVLVAVVMACSIFLALMADSRSNFIGLAIGIGTFTLWKYRFRGFVACVAVMALLAAIYSTVGRVGRTYVNRDIDTFTGRTTMWSFELKKLGERPLTGYGYDNEGAIFNDRRYPDWNITEGSNMALHNSYLALAVDLGLPALAFWSVVFLTPWISLFRRREDEWGLKPIFFIAIVPALTVSLVESGLAEPRYLGGLLVYLCWLLAECYRLALRDREASQRSKVQDSAGALNIQRLLAM
jgi:O-antigen ligase